MATCVCIVCVQPLCTETGSPNTNGGGNGAPQPGSSAMVNMGALGAGQTQRAVIALKCGHIVHEQCFQTSNLKNPVRKCPQCLITIPRNAKLLPLFFLGDATAIRKRELEAANKREQEVNERYEARLREVTAKCEASVKTAEKAHQDYQDLKQDYERKAALIAILSFEHEENQQKIQEQTKKFKEMGSVLHSERGNGHPGTTPSTKNPSCASDETDFVEPSPKMFKEV